MSTVPERLKVAADAYQEALECDICESGIYQGLRPDEIAGRICDLIAALVKGE